MRKNAKSAVGMPFALDNLSISPLAGTFNDRRRNYTPFH
jgi:hypothetical protein